MKLANFPRYWKAAVATCAPVFLVIQSAVTGNEVTSDEWAKIGSAVVAAILVWAVPNAPKPPAHEPATDRTPRM